MAAPSTVGLGLPVEGIREIHRRFCELLPEDLLRAGGSPHCPWRAAHPGRKSRTARAISAGALPRFLDRFQHVYGSIGKAEYIISSAAAHHRLLWMHPFLDGNAA
jgi:Fic family protein